LVDRTAFGKLRALGPVETAPPGARNPAALLDTKNEIPLRWDARKYPG